MQIMAVKPFGGKSAKRYHVHFYLDGDGVELDMPLYGGELTKYNIEEGAELPDSTFFTICEEILRTRIITRCEYLLNIKAYTEKELREKLRDGFYPEPLIDEAISVMASYHFIDDVDYAARYVELNGHKKSKRMITYELRDKGISEYIIEEVTADLDEVQFNVLENLMIKKCNGKNLNDTKEVNKIYRYFLGKGFKFEEISGIIDRLKE